jgi:hypothetical protein
MNKLVIALSIMAMVTGGQFAQAEENEGSKNDSSGAGNGPKEQNDGDRNNGAKEDSNRSGDIILL